MLFATIDYYHYKQRKGKYSHKALTDLGLRKARQSEFPNWKDVKLGNILFVHTAQSRLSWLVMYFSDISISHAAMLDDGGIVHDFTIHGVVRHSLENYFDGESYLSIINFEPESNKEDIRAWLDKNIDANYSWLSVFLIGFHILIANDSSFSWRLFFDALIFGMLILAIASMISKNLFAVLLLIGALYIITVIINKTLRKKPILK